MVNLIVCLVDAGISGRLHFPQFASVGVPIDHIQDFLCFFDVQVIVHSLLQRLKQYNNYVEVQIREGVHVFQQEA